ncbi:hypothetical protein HMPREF1475_00828 [Hoylesella oralis HGA0225]|nr:hypothetical protein HMPREF1475_00828 [Hoylesella oralis HGA0225]ETD19990.1 hypothetical protein HMPREF1199_00885 [Hoylesella oralis CC98A]SHF70790.1 hypothetical protein SAMN05444288_1287 [Hoylesella oralis]
MHEKTRIPLYHHTNDIYILLANSILQEYRQTTVKKYNLSGITINTIRIISGNERTSSIRYSIQAHPDVFSNLAIDLLQISTFPKPRNSYLHPADFR